MLIDCVEREREREAKKRKMKVQAVANKKTQRDNRD